MTDEHLDLPGIDTDEQRAPEPREAPDHADEGTAAPTEPWLREGADAPDAADIEDPATQR
jgi:hypothetical protein